MQVNWRVGLGLACLVLIATALLTDGLSLSAQQSTSGFTPNQELALPLTAGSLPLKFIVRGLEPSSTSDAQGTIYVSSIRGVPTGVDLHRWSPVVDPPPNADGTLPFVYLGRPDGCGIFASGCDDLGIAEGGGDSSLAVNDPTATAPNVVVTSLTLAPGVTSTNSADRGTTFSQPNVAAALIPGDDRQWTDAIDASAVYLSYHDVATFNIEVQRSGDGGQTYATGFGEGIDPATILAAGGVPPTNTANIAGQIKVDRTSCPSRGNLYVVFVAPDNATENLSGGPPRSVYVGVSTNAKRLTTFTFTDHKVWTGPAGSNFANIFPALAVDAFGNVFVTWSDNTTIYYASSTDQGATWSTPVVVNQGTTVGKANVFPWIAADANGHVAISWFGDNRVGNSNDAATLAPCATGDTSCMLNWANWNVYVAETVNGASASPTFNQMVASDHVIHRGTVSTGGLGGSADRSLGDFFQLFMDPQHRVNTAFSDDHKVNPLGPDNGPDNPTTRRLIRSNFTREVAATAGIVGSAGCSVGAPEPGPEEDGQGTLDSSTRFSFEAESHNAALQFSDSAASLKARSSNGADSITFSGNCVTITGNAKVNDQPGFRYSVDACDVANPGAGKDSFNISLTGVNFSYQKGGAIASGDIAQH